MATETIEVGGSEQNYKRIHFERKLETKRPAKFDATINYADINYWDLVEIKRDGTTEFKGFVEIIDIRWDENGRYLYIAGRDTDVILWKKYSDSFSNMHEDTKGFFGRVSAQELTTFLLRTPKSDFDPEAYPNNKEGWGIDASRMLDFSAARTSIGDPNYCKLRRRGYGWRNSGDPFASEQDVVDSEISRVDWVANGLSPYLSDEDDVNFIESNVADAVAVYSFTDLPATATSIEKVHLTIVWKPDQTWWFWINSECWVYISDDGGTTWHYVGFFGGRESPIKPNPWRHFTFDVSNIINTVSKLNSCQVKFVNKSTSLSTNITQSYLSVGYSTSGTQEIYDRFDMPFENETIVGIYVESRMDDESYPRDYDIVTVINDEEILSGYAEVDPNNHISVVGIAHINFDAYQDEDAYLYYDYGADYFGTYFRHTFNVNVVTDPVPEDGIMAGIWCLSNRLDDLVGLHTSGTDEFVSLEVYKDPADIINGGAPCFRLCEQNGGAGQVTYSPELTEGTIYSVIIERIGTALTAIIYAGGAVFSTLSLTLVGGNNYQYCVPAVTANDASVGVHTDIDISNLVIEKETILASVTDNIYRDIIHSWTPQSMNHIRIKITAQDLSHSWAVSQVYIYKAESVDYRVLQEWEGLGTLYCRTDNHTINGLTAYKLLSTQCEADDESQQDLGSGTLKHYWGIRVWKRDSEESETELTSGTPEALVNREVTSCNFGNEHPSDGNWINNPANSMIIVGPFTACQTGKIKYIHAYMFVPALCNCKAVVYDADHNELLGTSAVRGVTSVGGGQWESFIFGIGVNIIQGTNYYIGICTTSPDVWCLYTNANNSTKNWYRDNDAACDPPNPYIGDDSGSDKPCIYAFVYYPTEGIQSASWNCPVTTLSATDAIRVRFYGKFEGFAWAELTGALYYGWITEQIGNAKTIGGVWTIYYYTKFSYPVGADTQTWLKWGVSYNTRMVSGDLSFPINQYISALSFDSSYTTPIGPLNLPRDRLIEQINTVVGQCHTDYVPYEWWLDLDSHNTFHLKNQRGSDLSGSVSFIKGTNLGGTKRSRDVSDTVQRVKIIGRGEGKRQEDVGSGWVEDTLAMSNVKSWYEDILSEKSLVDKTVAELMANIYLGNESEPKDEPILTVNNDPYTTMEYDVGDIVTATDSLTNISGTHRIYNITKTVEDDGEVITMTVDFPKRDDREEWVDLYRRLKELELAEVIAADWTGEADKQSEVSAEVITDFFEKTAKNDEDAAKRDIKDLSWYMEPNPSGFTADSDAFHAAGGPSSQGTPAYYDYPNGRKWTHNDEWMKIEGPNAGNAIQTLLVELRGGSGEEINIYMRRNPKLVFELKVSEDVSTPIQWYNGDYLDIGLYNSATNKGYFFRIKALGGALFKIYACWNETGVVGETQEQLIRTIDRNIRYRFEIITEDANSLVIFNVYDMDQEQKYPPSAIKTNMNRNILVRPLYLYLSAFDDNSNPNVRATAFIYKFRTEWEKVQ